MVTRHSGRPKYRCAAPPNPRSVPINKIACDDKVIRLVLTIAYRSTFVDRLTLLRRNDVVQHHRAFR